MLAPLVVQLLAVVFLKISEPVSERRVEEYIRRYVKHTRDRVLDRLHTVKQSEKIIEMDMKVVKGMLG